MMLINVGKSATRQASGLSLVSLTPSPGNQQDILKKGRRHLLWVFSFICKS